MHISEKISYKICNNLISTTQSNWSQSLIKYNNYTPQITLPTRITDRSATLTDNIFLNTQCHKQTSGNITTSISDHLPQFTILEKLLGTRNIIGKEQITYCNFKNFNEIEFICDIQSMDWLVICNPKQ